LWGVCPDCWSYENLFDDEWPDGLVEPLDPDDERLLAAGVMDRKLMALGWAVKNTLPRVSNLGPVRDLLLMFADTGEHYTLGEIPREATYLWLVNQLAPLAGDPAGGRRVMQVFHTAVDNLVSAM
jgi:hypothetical protein